MISNGFSDAALAFSFSMDVPFLPQIPIRNPWEYMIAQALEDKVVIVTSFSRDVTGPFAEAFQKKHPGTKVEVQSRSTTAGSPGASPPPGSVPAGPTPVPPPGTVAAGSLAAGAANPNELPDSPFVG